MSNIVGVDIGGTKTSVIIGSSSPEIFAKEKFETLDSSSTLKNVVEIIKDYQSKYGNIESIGISCGGPLSSKDGIIICPPNLPQWKNVEIVKYFDEHLNIHSKLENDANACAIAEYLWGAGNNTSNMAFFTFGTGLGAGLILNGQLYRGASDMAGEIGHIRLNDEGPMGYNKAGSFEGFCSGGGIVKLCEIRLKEKSKEKDTEEFISLLNNKNLTTYEIANIAKMGNKFAVSIFEESAFYLGRGISILIDILNLEKIIIGGIYTRMESYFKDTMLKIIKFEALEYSANFCEIVPSFLGESIGDYSALAVAMNKI
ncbi:ROK family protein [Brachyspira sp.]|uniref:ROK family protein n=1 Tax=Brachyspira sp. TaxID=1977261 RepID=UPI002633FAAD|nr:ROK family protein [Brachyspira sp.]